jgi:hypothetical protein
MNFTQKLDCGRPRGRTRERGRQNEPGKAEDGFQVCQETGHQKLD